MINKPQPRFGWPISDNQIQDPLKVGDRVWHCQSAYFHGAIGSIVQFFDQNQQAWIHWDRGETSAHSIKLLRRHHD